MYDFKRGEEFAWAVGTAAAVALFQVAATFEPAKITDWKTWAIGGVAAAVRAAGGAALAFISRPKSSA